MQEWKHLHFVQVGVMNAVLVSDGNIFFLWGHERWHLSPRHDFDPTEPIKRPGHPTPDTCELPIVCQVIRVRSLTLCH